MLKNNPDADREPPSTDSLDAGDLGERALDTLGSVLRSMAEFALEQESMAVDAFREQAEAWAQHVLVAAPAPGRPAEGDASQGARRDWQGVRRFVREYCRSSSRHAAGVTADLREVIWVFIRNFSQAFALDEEMDARLQEQVAHLERLVGANATSELKREVTDVLDAMRKAFEERHERQRVQIANLGKTVRALGYELEEARRAGETDPLTGVLNRKALDAYLDRTVEIFKAFRHDACLLVIDLDRFKEVNDSYGHVAGDQSLRAVADAITRVFLRKSDFVARFGGDEFAVVLRETSLADVLPLASRVLSRVRALKIRAGDRDIAPTVSIGVAAVQMDDDARTWFERADRGLFQAKSEGRDRVAVGS